MPLYEADSDYYFSKTFSVYYITLNHYDLSGASTFYSGPWSPLFTLCKYMPLVFLNVTFVLKWSNVRLRFWFVSECIF